MKQKIAKKISFVILAASFLFGLWLADFSYADNTGDGLKENFYVIYVNCNIKTKELQLSENDSRLSVTVDIYNFTDDKGSGSQFYATVIDSNGNKKTFKSDKEKFFLGDWSQKFMRFYDGINERGQLIGGSEKIEEREIKISIPYFPDGQRIDIFESGTDKLALSIDVSEFSKRIVITKETEVINQQEVQPAEAKSYRFIILLIITIIIAIIAGVFLWRKYKASKEF